MHHMLELQTGQPRTHFYRPQTLTEMWALDILPLPPHITHPEPTPLHYCSCILSPYTTHYHTAQKTYFLICNQQLMCHNHCLQNTNHNIYIYVWQMYYYNVLTIISLKYNDWMNEWWTNECSTITKIQTMAKLHYWVLQQVLIQELSYRKHIAHQLHKVWYGIVGFNVPIDTL